MESDYAIQVNSTKNAEFHISSSPSNRFSHPFRTQHPPSLKKVSQQPPSTASTPLTAKLIILSSFSLAQRHTLLLSKGPKFTPVSPPKTQFKSDMKKFTRRVKIQEVFFDKESNDICIHRNKSNRPIFTENHEVNNICNLIEYLKNKYRR